MVYSTSIFNGNTDMTQDYTTISNPKSLYRAELHHPFPEWVASSPLPESQEFEKKAAVAFADRERRLLPICDKISTFHSAIDLFANVTNYDELTFDRVKEACDYYGIQDDIRPYVELFAAELSKSADFAEPTEGRFAISDDTDADLLRLLPINDAHEVRVAAVDLSKMAGENRIPFVMFVDAAREIVKAASDYNIDEALPRIVTHFGTERLPDTEKAAQLIQGRNQLCKTEALRDSVGQLYQEAIATIETDADEALSKIATIDELAGVSTNYRVSSRVPTPFDIVFSGITVAELDKAAKENVVVREVLIPISVVQAIDRQKALYCLSKSAAETLLRLRDSGDAKDLSLAADNWTELDQKTLLRLAVDTDNR